MAGFQATSNSRILAMRSTCACEPLLESATRKHAIDILPRERLEPSAMVGVEVVYA